ncbi:MAG TPA: helix-turn-helix domain-containing protein [Acidimicrobiales bacterium]|nr:helix-turn-helix domain-containing protein [Acidimicrobiales bacterium]
MTRRRTVTLVGPGEVARALGVSRATVRQWVHRELLPEPLAVLDSGRTRAAVGESAGMPVWDWQDIAEWADETGRPVHAEP